MAANEKSKYWGGSCHPCHPSSDGPDLYLGGIKNQYLICVRNEGHFLSHPTVDMNINFDMKKDIFMKTVTKGNHLNVVMK